MNSNTPLIEEVPNAGAQPYSSMENMNQPNSNLDFHDDFGQIPLRANANLKEKILDPMSGWWVILFIFLFLLISVIIILAFIFGGIAFLLSIPFMILFASLGFTSQFCFVNPPNTATILMFCNKYQGTIKKNGFFCKNPFYSLQKVSLKTDTFNSPIVKVNDKIGNPINVGCVVMWRVNDCNKAVFDVENYRTFLSNQCETAIRNVCCKYPYDKVSDDDVSLRSANEIVHQALKTELGNRLKRAGILVEDARISEISYSTEISGAMLKRQAAEALILGRDRIVRGAVDTVSQCVVELETKNICKFQDKNKSRMIGNLMVVLCSDSQVHPVVNAGAV